MIFATSKHEVRDQKRYKFIGQLQALLCTRIQPAEIYTFQSQYIHWWIYYDVTNNCILDLQRKIMVSFIYPMRSRVVCKGTLEEHL